MSALHVRQIAAFLTQNIGSRIDLTDVEERPTSEQDNHLLTRSLAAFALMHLGGLPEAACAGAVTDGYNDNGIDAAHYDQSTHILYLVQSKWRQNGQGGISQNDIQDLVRGLKDLVNARWERFNDKMNKNKDLFEKALNDAKTRIMLIFAHTGQQGLGEHARRVVNDLLHELNDPVDIVNFHALLQGDVYSAVQQGAVGAPINFDVMLYDWGQVRAPYHAYYGQVAASDIATWWNLHYPRLFAPNIRMFLGATDVNSGIEKALAEQPENFWYFNNGITALCSSVSRKPIGGNSREFGTFECRNVQIVNGAQTAGAIAAAQAQGSPVEDARVTIRFISLENCPDDFGRRVTRATNTQNRVESRDFVALDGEQERMQTELQLDDIEYVYKSGDTVHALGRGFDLTEATVARACAQPESDLCVMAKGAIGRLWEDITRPPYRTLFHSGVSGPDTWQKVQVLRVVEARLRASATGLSGRDRLIRVHGNRFVLHHVFRRLREVGTGPDGLLSKTQVGLIESTVDSIIAASLPILEATYPDAYLASLFKNQRKTREVSQILNENLT